MDSFAPIVPSGICSCVQLCEAQNAISAAMLRLVGIGKPSKYAAFPLLSLGTLPVVTLKRANRASPARTKKVRKSWSNGVLIPMANAVAAGATPKDIKSASESSSWPIKLLFFLHLATLPSKKSKNRPNGMRAKAIQSCVLSSGEPKQYRMEDIMELTPQKPFISVMRSAR